ncbi:helix-turn-helix transcriptional regulator [Ensifer sp. PDNC004]|nr:helix-turn-helix transcriptional regulator [Ensifer sp. PDNC004]
MSTLVERIRYRLEATGKNATSVAEEIGANRTLVRDILIGKSRSPSLDTVRALCGPLECSLAYLVGIEEPEDAEEPINKFWMVYGIGQQQPTYRHYSFSQAADEAKRLAGQNPGIQFVVLEALEAFKAERPRIITIGVVEDADDGIPF